MDTRASMQSVNRIARWSALLLALAAYVYLIAAPLYTTGASTSSGPPSLGSATLLDVNGLKVLAILAVPVLAAALPFLPLVHRARKIATVTAATIAALFVLLGAMTVGSFFLPTALALIVAAGSAGKSPRPDSGGLGSTTSHVSGESFDVD